MFAVGANGTAIMAALPTMRTELFLSSADVQWAVNAYLVVSAACIVLGGQGADRFGARLASMVGLALFSVASCIIAAAGTGLMHSSMPGLFILAAVIDIA
jgi:MFS family permease